MKKLTQLEAEQAVSDILERGVGMFVDPDQVFRKKLVAKATGTYPKDIVIKFGVDPTRPDIHLGHAVVLRKLRQLQELGCKIVFLIGDITAQIGDPTGKSKVRPEVAQTEILKNLGTYLDQIGKIMLVERDGEKKILHTPQFSWIKNSDWYVGVTDLMFNQDVVATISGHNQEGVEQAVRVPGNSFLGKAALYNHQFNMQINELHLPNAHTVSLLNLLAIMRKISYAQLIERDLFQDRINSGEPLFMHEMLYPVLQGTDSKVIAEIYGSCDLEIGGTDQTFNMLMGRKIMELTEQDPQAVLACSLLIGLDGKEKMSKSLDNYIGITDAPADMFGKVMSTPDVVLVHYFELCTFSPMTQVAEIKRSLAAGKAHPKDLKMDLAQQIVEIYHGRSAGEEARKSFIQTFQERAIPTEIPSKEVKKGTLLVDALMAAECVGSKSEFRRLLDEGAIRRDGETKIDDAFAVVNESMVIKVGKHRFYRFLVS